MSENLMVLGKLADRIELEARKRASAWIAGTVGYESHSEQRHYVDEHWKEYVNEVLDGLFIVVEQVSAMKKKNP